MRTGTLDELRSLHATHVDAHLQEAPGVLAALPGVTTLEVDGTHVRLTVAQADLGSVMARLAGHGIVFNELVDGTRKAIALDYLQDQRYRLIDIAQIVGYSEASSLTRACRRWTDKSPTQLRRQRPGVAGAGEGEHA